MRTRLATSLAALLTIAVGGEALATVIPFPAPVYTGAMINGIYRNSPALLAGLQRGDVIVQINGRPVRTAMDFNRLMAGGGRFVTLLVRDIYTGRYFYTQVCPVRGLIGVRFVITRIPAPPIVAFGGGTAMIPQGRPPRLAIPVVPMPVAPQVPQRPNAPQQPVVQQVQVDGKLQTGVAAFGADTTGILIHTKQGVFELEFGKNRRLRQKSRTLNGKAVMVKGNLEMRQGLQKQRQIIHVSSIDKAK